MRHSSWPTPEIGAGSVLSVIEQAKVEGRLGLDLEYGSQGPTIIGVASRDRCAAWNWEPALGFAAVDSGVLLSGHSVIGADKPVIERPLGITTPLGRWSDTMLKHWMVNPDLSSVPKSLAQDERDDPDTVFAFMNLWCATSLLHDVPNWKQCLSPLNKKTWEPTSHELAEKCSRSGRVCPHHSPLSYCAVDAWAGLVNDYSLDEKMQAYSIPASYYEWRSRLTEYCDKISAKGIRIDLDVVNGLEKAIQSRKATLFPAKLSYEGKPFKDGRPRVLKKPRVLWEGPFNPNSPKAVVEWFQANGIALYDRGGKQSMGKQVVLAALAKHLKPYGLEFDPRTGELSEDFDGTLPEPVDLLMRLAQKTIAGKGLKSWFDATYILNGKAHPRFITTGTSTSRLSSARPNCFDEKTEVLTTKGWKFLKQLDDEDLVAQWENDQISFVRPLAKTSRFFEGEMVSLQNEHIDLRVTDDHRCLLFNRKSKQQIVCLAKDYKLDHLQLNAAEYVNETDSLLSDDELKFLLAVQADSSIAECGLDFTFKKARKADRLEDILYALGYEVKNYSSGDRYRYLVTDERALSLVRTFLGEKKLFGEWVLRLSFRQLKLFVAESRFWDGLFGSSPRMYASMHENNTDWMQIAAILSGTRCNKVVYVNQQGSVSFQANFSQTNRSGTVNIKKTFESVKEQVYCLSVPSSFVIVRRNGKVCITGQCQNIPRVGFGAEVRKAIIAEPGCRVLKADFSQLEFRICLWAAGLDPNLADGAFELLVEKSDGQFQAAADRLSWKARDVAKSVIHGGDYLEGLKIYSARELSKPKLISERREKALLVYDGQDLPEWTFRGGYVCFTGGNLAERVFGNRTRENRAKALKIQQVYLDAFPQIREFQQKVGREIEHSREVRLPSGHRVPLYGRTPEDDLKYGAAVWGQGGGAIYVQEGMLHFSELGLVMNCQVHDEFFFTDIPQDWSDEKCLDFMSPMIRPSTLLPGFSCPAKVSVSRIGTWQEGDREIVATTHNWKQTVVLGTIR